MFCMSLVAFSSSRSFCLCIKDAESVLYHIYLTEKNIQIGQITVNLYKILYILAHTCDTLYILLYHCRDSHVMFLAELTHQCVNFVMNEKTEVVQNYLGKSLPFTSIQS